MKACLRSAQQDGRILRRIWDECGIEGVWFMKSILREKLQECQRTVEKCKARQAAAFEDYAEGRIRKQEYLSRKKEISGQQEEAAREYAELSDRLAEAVSERGKETVDLGRYDFVNELTREVLEELVKVVRVSENDALEIVWNFKE